MGENWTFDAENLTVGYDGKTVIADVNFSVGAGERILLCGANGLGKSTLLRTLALLQPPVSGKCSFSSSSEKCRPALIPARIPKVEGFSVEQFVAASCYLETDWLGRIPALLKNQIKTAVESVGIPELSTIDTMSPEISVIFSSHDIYEASRHCTRIFGIARDAGESKFIDSGANASETVRRNILSECFRSAASVL